jgi:predicted DNA-binding protein (MmcQ/YjbR family)
MRAKRVSTDDPLVNRLRKICMALPEAVEKLSHGEPTWFAGKGKVFAMLDNHHHEAEHLAVWLPQPLGAQEALVDADARRFFRPPYVGPSGWVGVVLDTKPDWGMVTAMVREAYMLVASQKLKAAVKSSPRAR